MAKVTPRSVLVFFLEEPNMTLTLYLLGSAVEIENFDAPTDVLPDQPPSKNLFT